MRILMVVELLADIGGLEEAVVALSEALSRAGHAVNLFSCRPVSGTNEYRGRLERAGVSVFAGPGWLYRLARVPWRTRDRLITLSIDLLAPLLLPIALVYSLRRHRSWRQSYAGARGRVRHWLGDRLMWDAVAYRPLARILRQFRPDIVHVHGWGLGVDPPFAIDWALSHGLSVVYTEHGVSSSNPGWERLPAGAERAHVAIGPSMGAVNAMAQYGVSRQRLAHIPYITLPPIMEEPIASPSAMTQAKNIVCVARLAPQKGHRYLLAAMKDVIRVHPDAHLYLVGDGSARRDLERLCRDLEITTCVTFVGAIPRSQIGPWYARAMMVVLPSLSEGLPNTLLEAMACARPIVTTDIEGTRELVKQGYNGILVPPKDHAALAEAICNLLANPDLCRQMGERGRNEFLSGPFHAPAVLARTIEAYNQAIAAAANLSRTTA